MMMTMTKQKSDLGKIYLPLEEGGRWQASVCTAKRLPLLLHHHPYLLIENQPQQKRAQKHRKGGGGRPMCALPSRCHCYITIIIIVHVLIKISEIKFSHKKENLLLN